MRIALLPRDPRSNPAIAGAGQFGTDRCPSPRLLILSPPPYAPGDSIGRRLEYGNRDPVKDR